jgi:uncharacterized protein
MIDQQNMQSGKDQLYRTGSLFLLVLSALAVVFIFVQVREYKYIGQYPTSEATISVTGDSETYQKPDIINLSYSVEYLGKTPKEATDEVAEKTASLREYLGSVGIDAKDVRTTGYNLYPEYDWVQDRAVICAAGMYCPPTGGKQVLKGYRLTESYDLKIHSEHFDKAGEILSGIAEKGATNVSGLTFKVENEEKFLEEVRSEAIAEARAKAERLAKELGVSIVRVQSYNEGTNYPIFYGRGAMDSKVAMAEAAPEANVQPGQEKLSTSDSITYVVR